MKTIVNDTYTDKIAKLNRIFQTHRDSFSGGFHNALWQIICNGALDDSESQHCFVALHDKRIVIASSGGGYLSGCHCYLKTELSREQVVTIAEQLSGEVFGLSGDAYDDVVLKSLAKRGRT